ncbi:MAG: DUF2076 domain-containing protein [Thiocapsa sp.]|uniref:DUF2076 domain-containing protein n=1 Tax=Thiocapsa sp. TaxID=2024551 RepID=UPI001BD057AE|nr:DUF2076 domain-containing protein [Thiocapsa sp.]QVL49985.1 MAG: DUF2076 domain-containing protein [Thiocapsa sp.]
MDHNEQSMIGDLFAKLKQAEQQAGPRDSGAEQEIAAAVSRQPAAPYYMSQVILVQEQTVQAQNQRIQELEKQLAERPAAGGGFLGGLFGGGAVSGANAARPAAERTPAMTPGSTPGTAPGTAPGMGFGKSTATAAPSRGWSQPTQPAGGGFMASALTTAAGVAGGIMMANALTGMFGGNEAEASETPAQPEEAPFESEEGFADDGGDFESFEEF